MSLVTQLMKEFVHLPYAYLTLCHYAMLSIQTDGPQSFGSPPMRIFPRTMFCRFAVEMKGGPPADYDAGFDRGGKIAEATGLGLLGDIQSDWAYEERRAATRTTPGRTVRLRRQDRCMLEIVTSSLHARADERNTFAVIRSILCWLTGSRFRRGSLHERLKRIVMHSSHNKIQPGAGQSKEISPIFSHYPC